MEGNPLRRFWTSILRALVLGVLGGLFTILYLVVVEEGTHFFWGDWESTEWFSGNWRMVVLPVTAGLLTGLVYLVFKLPARFQGFIAELENGQVDYKSAPGAVVVALISLIGGASLGPEGPLATAGGAAGTWLGRRSNDGDDGIRTATFTGMSSVFGALLGMPMAAPLLAFELEHEQDHPYYFQHLIPGFVSGAVGFAVVWPVLGSVFTGLYSFENIRFRSWMLLASVAIGIVGAVTAVLVGAIMKKVVDLFRRLDVAPVLRGLVSGGIVGLIAFAMPLTLFSGTAGLQPIASDPASLGVTMLLVLALLKTVALAVSLGGGFYGGAIFPMFFIGGTVGAAIHLVIPAIPLGLAIASAMAAIAAALAMVPLSMSVFAAFLVGADIPAAGAILMAAVTAFALRYGLQLWQGQPRSDTSLASGKEPES